MVLAITGLMAFNGLRDRTNNFTDDL